MAVIIGSARGSWGNTTRGDQNGGIEVSTQNWYRHSKGWRAFRAIDPAKRAKLAYAMKAACANNKIGYSQPDRLALFNQIKNKGYDPALATEPTNVDCSALVRVCCYYAGIYPKNFVTSGEASALLSTGEFIELTDPKYTTRSDYLGAGDILVTKTKGHTVIVLTSGSKYQDVIETEFVYHLGERTLENGSIGGDVKELQILLINLGYSCGSWGADGEFGDATEQAVKKYQSDHGLVVDGKAGKATIAAITNEPDEESGSIVRIVGGNCYVRSDPSIEGEIIGGAKEGSVFTYAGEKSVEGWHKIRFKDTLGWVSGKYSMLEG